MLPIEHPFKPKKGGHKKWAGNRTPLTIALTRGVCRLFADMGYGTLTEFRLSNGRRVDVMALDTSGGFSIIEVKSTVADFRNDVKWMEYLPYSDRFYFAVSEHFPIGILPDDYGIIIADSFGATVEREAPEQSLNATRKRQQLRRFALTASERLQRLSDARP